MRNWGWKFQYSLSSLLWFTICCALLVSSVLMYRRMSKAERESAILRGEAGYLDVGDRNLFHAVSIKTYEPYAWRWRVYVPPKHRFLVKAVCGEIPHQGWPVMDGQEKGVEGVAREMVLNAAVRQDKDGKWMLHLTFRDQQLGVIESGGCYQYAVIPLSDSAAEIIDHQGYGSNSNIFGGDGVASQSMEKPIILLRHRMFKNNGPGTGDPTPGIMIWLEEK